jgi:hypothetical protein
MLCLTCVTQVWTSSRNRCRGTCQPFLEVGFRVQQFTQMSEINPGVIVRGFYLDIIKA